MALPTHTDTFTRCHQDALCRKVFVGDGGIEDIAAIWNCALLDGCRSSAQCKASAIELIRERAAEPRP